MPQLSTLKVEDLDKDQKEVLDAIWTGPRAKRHGNMGLVGPFDSLVRVPKVGFAVQALGKALRFGSSIPEGPKEIAICTVGAFYRAKFEFAAHRPLAEEAGVSPEALDRLARQEEPGFKGDEQLAYAVAHSMMTKHEIDEATFAKARDCFTENGLIELVTLIGFYSLVSQNLKAFEKPLVEGMPDPFPGE